MKYSRMMTLALAGLILIGTAANCASASVIMGQDVSYIDSNGAHWSSYFTYDGTSVPCGTYLYWENDLWNMNQGTTYWGQVSYSNNGQNFNAQGLTSAGYYQEVVIYPTAYTGATGSYQISTEKHKYSTDGIHWDAGVTSSVSHSYSVTQ